MNSPSGDILFERSGSAGLVILNRPKALNALTHEMVRALHAQLKDWAADDAVTRVIVSANGERAFCAGGDIRALYELGQAKKFEEALQFFREEYTLNAYIKRYPKPYVSLIDGLVMGGGVGISVHGSHRVAGDGYSFGMPEVGIGFFPDVGATYALTRLPGEIGTWCALTGGRLGAADAVGTGAATHYVTSDRLPALRQALCDGEPVNAVLASHMGLPAEGEVMARRRSIDRLFSHDSVEAILGALDREAATGAGEAAWAAATARDMRTKSPTSLKIALAQMRYGRAHAFEACMGIEFRIVSRILREHDLYEGVRAVIIDKDNKPVWRPARLADVPGEAIDRYFAPIADELSLP